MSPSSVEPEVSCTRPVSDLQATGRCDWLPSLAFPRTSSCNATVFFVVVGGTVDQGTWTLATVREDCCFVRRRHGHRQSERVAEQHGHVRQSVCFICQNPQCVTTCQGSWLSFTQTMPWQFRRCDSLKELWRS